jgi:hypothetical protein
MQGAKPGRTKRPDWMLSEGGREVAQTIDQSRPRGEAALPALRVWNDIDLALADARIVAELARRIEIWVALNSSAEDRNGAHEPRHDLSGQTVRELLSVVEVLTRREAARLAAHPAE